MFGFRNDQAVLNEGTDTQTALFFVCICNARCFSTQISYHEAYIISVIPFHNSSYM